MRNKYWRRVLGVGRRNWLLYAPSVRLRLNWLGSGTVFRSARPFLLIRFWGMMLPGKLAPESGSRTDICTPPGFSDWEKSPALSKAVGKVWTAGVDPADRLGLLSKLKK